MTDVSKHCSFLGNSFLVFSLSCCGNCPPFFISTVDTIEEAQEAVISSKYFVVIVMEVRFVIEEQVKGSAESAMVVLSSDDGNQGPQPKSEEMCSDENRAN